MKCNKCQNEVERYLHVFNNPDETDNTYQENYCLWCFAQMISKDSGY